MKEFQNQLRNQNQTTFQTLQLPHYPTFASLSFPSIQSIHSDQLPKQTTISNIKQHFNSRSTFNFAKTCFETAFLRSKINFQFEANSQLKSESLSKNLNNFLFNSVSR